MVGFNASAGIAPLTASTKAQLRLDYSETLNSLMRLYDSELMGRGDGYFSQDNRRGNAFSDIFMTPDLLSKRVVLNQYKLAEGKDQIRIIQEKLRFIFTITKIISDAFATIAAQLGDENKIKTAAGLQKLFETSFGLVSVDVQLQDYLFSHYETAVSHNFDVRKIRYERRVDSSFKTANILAVLMGPAFGKLFETSISIFQTLSIYFDYWGSNDFTDHYLKENFFDSDGFLQSKGAMRYEQSTLDQNRRYQLASQNNMGFGQARVSVDALAYYRQYSFDLMLEATKIQPLRTGLKLSLIKNENGNLYYQQSVNYNAFNDIREKIVAHGMNAQKNLMMLMSMTGYLSSLAKSLRGDGKVGGQHLSSLVDVMEREISHDLDELGRIQSFQEQVVSLNNQKFDSLKRVERTYYEMIFFAFFFGARLVSSSMFTVFDIIMVKAFANMFQGVMLSFINYDEKRLSNELEEINDVSANQKNINAVGYGQGQPREINYSGIGNYESNYLDFSSDSSNMILSSGYGNDAVTNFLGLGFKSNNWFEQAHQNMMLKKLFAQWNLILKSGQSVAEAYQSIADELGAVTSSMGYSSALRTQMNIQKSLMTKNLDNRFSLAGQVVNVFNSIQSERFESMMQGIKYVVSKAAGSAYNKQQASRRERFADSGQGSFKKGVDLTQYTFVEFLEEMFRTITGAVRRTHLEGQRRDLISDAEQSYTKNYQSGSYSESMLYMSNIKKAKQKVNADIIGKVKSFDGFFKTVILNLKDTWQNKVQEQSRKDLGFDRISQQGDKLAKSLILNDSQKAQDALRYFSSLMSKSSTSSRPSYLYNLGRSVISVFSRQMERDLQSEKSAKQSLSVWSSIERLHKQMLRYGGSEDALAGQFGSEMNMLNKSINDLDTLNQNSIPKPISINQLSLVESISASVNRLLSIANEFDNERQEQNKLWQFYRTMRNPHIRPLSQLALNIDHFATYASVGMAINLNQHVKNKTIENKQDMLKVMQWIKARAEKDPQRRVYRDLGEYFTQLSYHAEDERHKTIVGFLENTLKGAPEHRDEAQQMLHDFSKRVLAAKTKGAKHTFKLLNRLGVPAHTFFNGHDGIIDIANYELKNYKAAKRWLFAKDESVKDHLSKTILTQGQSKVYAKSLLACAHADPDGWPDKGRFGEGYFSSFVFAKSVPRYVGLGRQYSNRLKRIVDDAMAAINEGSIKEQKDKILAAFDFGLELTKGNLKIDSILASDYVFEQLSEAVRKNADLEFQFDDIKDHLPRLQWGGVDGNPAHKVFGEVLINGGQKDINESYSTSALSFDSIEKVESFHVKRAINWASENKKESIWFNALFNAHPTEVIRFLSQLKPDDLKPYFELFKNVSVENPTQAFQFKLLGFDQLTPPTNDTEAIEWVQIIWPAHEVNKMQPTDLEDPFLKRFQDELALGLASDQVANILKTVPGKLIQALFDYDKVRKSQFSNVTGQNDVPQDLGEEMVGQSMDHDTPTLANGDFSAAPDLIPIVGQYSQAAPHQSEDNSNNPLSLFLHKVKNNDSNMLSFIKQAMIFQPDLAIHLIHDRKQFLDINSFAVDLATLTAWAMDVPKICDIFDCFNEDSKHKFLRQILVQSDCAAELFFHLKPNAFDWMDGFSQDEIDKALFFKCEFSQSAYDELSPAQRQDCIYNKRSDIETNISDCIDALNENDKIVFLKELIQKESTQLYQNANGLPSKILSNSVSEQISTANELLFFYETLKPILDDFERKRVNELDAVFKSLDECVRQDKFFGGANALVIQLEMKAFLSKHRDRFFSHIKDNPGDLDLLKNVMNLYQTYSPKDLIWMQEHADGSDYPDTIKAYVKKYQITQRVNALVADSILREKFHYRPVSEISTQFSMIPERYQLDVYTSILDQFNLFASQDQLASISRMLDVVYGLVPYILQNSDSSTKDNYQSCTLKFLKQVVTSGIELNAPQKQGLIFLIHSMETSKEKFLDFNRLEHQVGIDVIIKYYFNEEKMYQRINSDFLKGLKSRIDLSLASPVVKQNPDFNDLWNSFEQSRYEFRAIAIDQIKRDQAKPIVKEILKASNDKAVEMLNEFYEIAKNEFNQAELQRIILEDIKVKFKANTFKELLLTNDFMTFFKDLSKLFKNDFFDGLQRGYVYDQRSTIKSVIDTKAPSKSIVGGYGKMLGAPELKFFVKACVKTDQVKVLNDFFQRQYSWTSREQGEKMIQLVINELVKSNMSFTQWVEFTADSSNQVRQEIYSELMHYFKPSSMQGQGKRLISKFLPGGNLDDSTRHHSKNYNFLNEKNFFNENSMKQVQLQNLIESITDLPKVGGVINNDDLLAHLLVSLPFIGKLPEPGNIYRLLNDKLEGLFHNDKFISKCERLISNDHFHLLKNSSAKFEKYQNLKSVIDSLKISRGQQVRYRLKLVNAHKIEKIKDMQTVYDLNSFLLSYKKYARNFEVDRTKTMSVSHVSGSLSIGT
ncbi:MAG: hypothetical protein VW397_04230 [Candidatus Margulisiibacteriota bacterium]